MQKTQQFCTFLLGDLLFGVKVADVLEVIRNQPMTRVPLAVSIRGLMNLRGQIVPAIDLRCRLGMPPLASDDSPVSVVVQTEEGPVSLLVDEVGDVLEVADALYEPPPETLRTKAGLIDGIYDLPGRLLHALALKQAAAIEETAKSARSGAACLDFKRVEFEDYTR